MASELRGSEAVPAARHGRAALEIVLALVLLALAGWYGSCRIGADRRSISDDAYITYGYARHVAEGRGFRFNAADPEPTPGCSTELHALAAAGAIAAGFDPLKATRALSLAAVLAIGLILGAAGARLAGAGARRGLVAGAAIAWVLMLLPETAVHLASGMETLLFTLVHAALFAWAAWAVTRRAGLGLPAAAGAPLLLLCVLARPEGVALAALYVAVVVLARKSGRGLAAALREGAPLLATTALIVGAYAAWRLATYGSLLANPFYVKSSNAIFGSRGDALPGIEACASFLLLRVAPALLVAWLARRAAPPADRAAPGPSAWLLLPSLCVLGAYAFVVHEMAAGSRFEVPMLAPWIGVAAAALLAPAIPAAFRALLAGMVIVAPAFAARVGGDFVDFARHPRSSALAWLRNPGTDNALARAGRDLGQTGLGGRATILLSAAGQIPWYSRFQAVDWIGLNDTRLSGRFALSIDEVWDYLEQCNPDVVQSILPPSALPASSAPGGVDGNFESPFVQATLDGRGSVLFAHWDRERLARMFQAEMAWVREHCVFGACYKLGPAWGDDWWVFLYVRKDSPHRERLLEVLRRSKRADRKSDLSERFPFDPRRLTD